MYIIISIYLNAFIFSSTAYNKTIGKVNTETEIKINLKSSQSN